MFDRKGNVTACNDTTGQTTPDPYVYDLSYSGAVTRGLFVLAVLKNVFIIISKVAT